MRKGLFLSIVFLFGVTCFANPGNPEQQLIKLSKSLRGVIPSLSERQALQDAQKSGTTDLFLEAKTQEYLKSSDFQLKLKQKVDEVMRLMPQTTSQPDDSLGDGDSYSAQNSAYDFLVRDLIANNQSWDQLLTAKNYRAVLPPNDFIASEYQFYSNVLPQAASGNEITDIFQTGSLPYPFVFAPQDQRVSGVLTTKRFFSRYVNTALNKNRRRAAAVFRIFLCDTMIPSVPTRDSGTEAKDYDKIFPDHSNLNEDQIRRSVDGAAHGTEADCMACHAKLDPLGQVFAFSAATLAPMASPGALHYTGYDGRKVDIPLQGFGDLGTQISQQPEYAKCQINRFWQWYIGKDSVLTQARESELIQKFNQVNRTPREFISYLVSLSEFKQKPQILTEDQVLARRVVKIFKNCNSCHDSQGEEVWDLTDLPYGKDPAERSDQLRTLKKVLDIDNDGVKPKMPPKDSLWKLSRDEFLTVKNWLAKGAPDFEGRAQFPAGGTP